MRGRNLETRVSKLEVITRRDDEVLMIWRRHDEDGSSAIEAARSIASPGDRIAMGVWYGDDALPEPRWLASLPDDLTEAEQGHLRKHLVEVAGERSRSRPLEKPDPCEMTDAELWFYILRVDMRPSLQ